MDTVLDAWNFPANSCAGQSPRGWPRATGEERDPAPPTHILPAPVSDLSLCPIAHPTCPLLHLFDPFHPLSPVRA